MNDKWSHIPLNKTFFSRSELVKGSYDVSIHMAINLNIDEIKESDIYEEVYMHEFTHLHLTTSTAIGHAMQFVAHCPESKFMVNLMSSLSTVSFDAQEGAALLTQWFFRKSRNASASMTAFKKMMPDNYKKAFDSFLFIWSRVLPDEMFGFTSIVANALGQYMLNTDILIVLERALSIGYDMTLQEYFMSKINHPTMRMIDLANKITDDEGWVFQDVKRELREVYKSAFFEVQSVCPESTTGNMLQIRVVDGNYTNESIVIRDIYNKHLLNYFYEKTGIERSVINASDVASQFRSLLKTAHEKYGLEISYSDTSSNLSARTQFKPIIRKI
jgi:hypothetical protein